MNKLYMATFYIKKGGFQTFAINLEAANLKEARQKLGNAWYSGYCKNIPYLKVPHQFGIKIRCLKPGEEYLYNWFVRVNAKA